jgi:hypothetical protein
LAAVINVVYRGLTGGVVLLACATLFGHQPPAPDSAQAVAIFHKYIRASDSELKRLTQGGVLTRTLDSPDGRELSIFGAIRVGCTPETFKARVRDIERFKASEYVLQIGRFQPDPGLPDVAALGIDPDERSALRSCRPGACSMRFPASAIEHFRQKIPWGGPNEAEQAAVALREFLVHEARAYLAGGSGVLNNYSDRPGTTARADAFRQLLRPSAFQAESQPDLFQWMDQFPRAHLEGVESFLYWSREKFGLKPVVSITHAALQSRPDSIAFVARQVYASHYFDASLGMAVYIAIPGSTDAYVTYLNRSRVDTLRGFFAPLARVIAGRRARDGLERMLIDVKRKLEASSRT